MQFEVRKCGFPIYRSDAREDAIKYAKVIADRVREESVYVVMIYEK